MSEKQVGLLYKLASTLTSRNDQDNACTQLLRSYYLMRCKEITKGYGLPRQQFSNKNRCSFCCLEWTRQTETKVKSNRVSKRQRKRIRQKKCHKDLLYSNKVEQICSFCKHHNAWAVLKPSVETKKDVKQYDSSTSDTQLKNSLVKIENSLPVKNRIKKINVYSKTREIFSLSNENNTISKTIHNEPKTIKNNKKKKDKFAGLCKQAVLDAAKLKKKKEIPNKLSLFLKPSAS